MPAWLATASPRHCMLISRHGQRNRRWAANRLQLALAKAMGEAVKTVVVRRPGAEVTAEELIAFVMREKGQVNIQVVRCSSSTSPNATAMTWPEWRTESPR